jgi:hypothetical protein
MAHMLASTYNGGVMPRKHSKGQILLISAAAAALTLLPYLLAARLAPAGTRFAGFLINPIDGFSYLSKMNQGADGSWLFTLPYTAQPGPGALLYVYHLFLGHLSDWSSLPLLTVYHAARMLAAGGAFALAYLFLDWTVADRSAVRFGWILTLLGSGFGWITTLAFNHPVSDMLIPESIPFLASLSNAHFPLALLATLAVCLAVAAPSMQRWLRLATAAFSGFVLGAVLPFSAVVPLVVLGLWVGYQRIAIRARSSLSRKRAWQLDNLLPYLAFLLFLAPWVLYDFWLSRAHPVLAAWNAQNQTPSPPPWDYALGFGVILLLAIIGMLRAKPVRSVMALLLIWVGAGSLLLYAPLAFQRRLSLGLFFPLSALAACGLMWLHQRGYSFSRLALAAVALALPSNVLVVGASVLGVVKGDRELVHTESELSAFTWLDEHAPPNSLVLASARIGNRLPAFADVNVLYGHPFETPNADQALDLVESLYRSSSAASELEPLRVLGVDYVFYGIDERELGHPGWLEALNQVASFDDVEIYQVPDP